MTYKEARELKWIVLLLHDAIRHPQKADHEQVALAIIDALGILNLELMDGPTEHARKAQRAA